ncbi:MAG: helix-turn-helix domain-containing protein [Pseudonocardiales bacterium]
MDDAEEAGTIGWALWRVRDQRGKSLRVVAGLAGMGKDTLNRIERGLLSPITRDALAVLLRTSRRGSPTNHELRGMARRAGLPG